MKNRRRRLPGKPVLVAWTLLGLLFFGFLIAPLCLKAIDKVTLSEIECKVTSVEPQQGSSISGGFMTSSHQVSFETDGCGVLTYKRTSASGYQKLADRIQVGEQYSFKIGASSRAQIGLAKWLGYGLTVYGLKPVSDKENGGI